MTTNFLYTQAPNRKGNASVRTASHDKGVTAVTSGSGGVKQPTGNQGAPAFTRASSNTAAGATGGRKQAVMVSRPKEYCGYAENTGYMNSDRTNYLK
jgi:hypothetical protein